MSAAVWRDVAILLGILSLIALLSLVTGCATYSGPPVTFSAGYTTERGGTVRLEGTFAGQK